MDGELGFWVDPMVFLVAFCVHSEVLVWRLLTLDVEEGWPPWVGWLHREG